MSVLKSGIITEEPDEKQKQWASTQNAQLRSPTSTKIHNPDTSIVRNINKDHRGMLQPRCTVYKQHTWVDSWHAAKVTTHFRALVQSLTREA